MNLGDTNGSKTKALEFFSKKFYDGLMDSDRQYRQFVGKKDYINMGQGNGDTFTVNLLGDLPKVGSLLETDETPSSDFDITKVSVTVTEYGGKINYTHKMKMIAQLPMEEVFKTKLATQAARSLDQEAHDLVFATTNWVATPTSATALTWTTNGTTAGNIAYALTLKHVLAISSKMRQNRVPLKEGKIFCIAAPTVLEELKSELTLVNQHTESGFMRIVQGMVGTTYGVVFIEENNVNSKNAYFCGDHVGIEVVVEPEHIVIGETTDLGRNIELGWRYIGAFKRIADNRIVKFVGIQ